LIEDLLRAAIAAYTHVGVKYSAQPLRIGAVSVFGTSM
jgi:hypothetical protein